MKPTLKQRFRAWLFDDDDANSGSVQTIDSHSLSDENCISFKVIPAQGGRIVQVQYYSERHDRHFNKLHLVTPDEDLAESLVQILHLETLSR
jgi:hypothetical protein